MDTIVVGIDGSKGSQRALEWALQEARLRTATLRVVYAASPPPLPSYVIGRAGGYAGPSHQQQEQVGQHLLDEALQAVGDEVPIEREVLLDVHPGKGLVDNSRDADLLVVGSRGLGGFEGLVLGSVGLHCVTHAACPVTVVRP